MKMVLKALGAILLLFVLFLGWAKVRADATMARTWDVSPRAFPIPAPLSEAEVAALRAERLSAWMASQAPAAPPASDDAAVTGAQATDAAPADGSTPPPVVPPADLLPQAEIDRIALERAVARGKHLVESRLGCFDCHGEDYAGKVVMDVPPVMRFIAPNITPAGVVQGMTDVDWVRVVRHGINRKGQSSIMPAIDYTDLSDQEIGDVISFVRSVPAVERVMEPWALGPVMWVQLALGKVPISAELIDHDKERPTNPPPQAIDTTYGAHLGQVCRGCHGTNLAGGKIIGGDPSWPPASNLTPHASGSLQDWTLEDWKRAMREGVRKDGSAIRAPMPWTFYGKMSDTELEALWVWIQQLPPAETGTR